ncbi:MAG: cyclase [Proteobacteria bacterium]|nr:cyclase [Pseudomonadota bacterium]
MATAIVRHRVSNYTEWRAAFDGALHLHQTAGVTGSQIFTSSNDENDVTAVIEFQTIDQAKAHFANAELKAAMQQAGVVSKPEIQFLEAR